MPNFWVFKIPPWDQNFRPGFFHGWFFGFGWYFWTHLGSCHIKHSLNLIPKATYRQRFRDLRLNALFSEGVPQHKQWPPLRNFCDERHFSMVTNQSQTLAQGFEAYSFNSNVKISNILFLASKYVLKTKRLRRMCFDLLSFWGEFQNKYGSHAPKFSARHS